MKKILLLRACRFDFLIADILSSPSGFWIQYRVLAVKSQGKFV